MTLDEFLTLVMKTKPPAPAEGIARLEALLVASLPDDYRRFLELCNGGYVGGALWFTGSSANGELMEVGVHHVGGFRDETYFSLEYAREIYAGRIPSDLLWIMDDPGGNAICLGLVGDHRGRIYFWDHELEPDPKDWNGQLETAGNVTLIASSFTEFVEGLKPS